ncbi:MAG: hypothetical protein J6J76_02210 [Paraprevotella sp.]|nr:hypothetical protein [Paraprevotella sp.]
MKTKLSRSVIMVFVTMCMSIQSVSAQSFWKKLGNSFNEYSRNNSSRSNSSSYNRSNTSSTRSTYNSYSTQQQEVNKNPDFSTLAAGMDWFPKNPALDMSEEERAAKYEEMKANDILELVDGNFKKIRKTYPDLIVFEYQQKGVDNTGNLTFTTLDGTVLTVVWDDSGTDVKVRYDALKRLYSHKDIRNGNDLSQDLKELFLQSCVYRKGEGKIERPNGDHITLSRSDNAYATVRAKIMDREKKGDYKRYSMYKGDFYVEYIRKTLNDCTIEMDYQESGFQGGFRIEYPNGEAYGGSLQYEMPEYEKSSIYGNFNAAVITASIINNADSLSQVGKICNGKMIDKDNNVKIYVNGEYDEIESIAYTQRIQAEERAKKEKAAQAMKQKQQLVQKYGQKYVNLVLNAEGKKISDVLVVGMPMGLLVEASDANEISLSFRKVRTSGYSTCYEFYRYGFNLKKETLGHIWTDRSNKISSVTYY